MRMARRLLPLSIHGHLQMSSEREMAPTIKIQWYVLHRVMDYHGDYFEMGKFVAARKFLLL